MSGFRSQKIEAEYELFKDRNRRTAQGQAKPFSFNWQEEAIEVFDHWALMPVLFHYDLIAEEHHLLVPKRIFPSFAEMNTEEFAELKKIKQNIGDRYSFILENLPSRLSVPTHFHLHFIKGKEFIQCDDCLD